MAPWSIYLSQQVAALMECQSLGLDCVMTVYVRGSVGAVNTELSRPDLLATVQSGRKQA